MRPRVLLTIGLLVGLVAHEARTVSQSLGVTSPAQEFGAAVGDDYFLATYAQLERYWKKIAEESDRVRLVSIGQTEEGREQWMAIVSAPENLERLDHYRSISKRLALAEVSDAEAQALAADGKAVVWINGGLHADEVLGAQQLIELVYELARGDDAETIRFLRDVIVLVAHANPDGHALVADWYMRERDPLRRSLNGLPRSYQKYIGHDNNRDFFLSSQAETTNMNRVLYKEWFPQVVLDHHQPGPAGTVMFAPPFRGPFNDVIDPLIPASIDLVGSAIQARFAAEGKRGVTMRGGAGYSGWWNGGLRTSAYFHNQIGLLTETTGEPAPIDLRTVPGRELPSDDLPLPISPQRWHFRQAVQYSMTANRAVIDFASRSRETLLLNAFTMARNAIAGRDRDTTRPAPVAYIISSAQPDFPTATKFVNALLKSGVVVHRAHAEFRVNSALHPAGSYVVKTAQPFRAHVLDMFEPQKYPDDEMPYDIAGWTLALQMGVRFERVREAFDGPFTPIDSAPPPGHMLTGRGAAGFLLRHRQNDSVIAVNRLLRAGEKVFWAENRRTETPDGTGSIYVPGSPRAREILSRATSELGVSVSAADSAPSGRLIQLQPVRIGLWDRYGGAVSSGWMRWLLERYEFPFDVVYVQAIDRGDLSEKYDVLILPDEAELQRVDRTPLTIPSEYRSQTGVLTAERSVPALRRFLERGGTVIVIGQAARMAEALGAAAEAVAFRGERDGRSSVSVPGSILGVNVDNTVPIGFGFESGADVFFDNGPVFRLTGTTATAVARFVETPLRSGWARGQEQLTDKVAAFDAAVGRGRVVGFGPQIAFRAQSHATFKFLFNSLYYAKAEPLTDALASNR